MAVNFTKNQDSIAKAWRQVTDFKDVQNWALFGYEGKTNNIALLSTGTDGLDELVREFHCSLIQYAFCRVIDKDLGINKLILINWQGESSPLSRKGLCASHVGDVANYFKGCSLTLTIRNDDEATKEYLMDQIVRSGSSSSRASLPKQATSATSNTNDNDSQIGSTYKKTDIKSEISMDRKSFWQRQEEEEKERLIEEKKRAAERQAQFEKERKLREETEAKKLVETIKERDRVIEAIRQADLSSNSQPNSTLSTNDDQYNDDERVGRRSELIRLERNQETLSLIGKGLIKNKRAIFEQASQQQQTQQPTSGTLARRTSGVVVSQRLNTFKSLDASGESSADIEKLTNGLAKTNVNNSSKDASPKVVERQVEPIEISLEKHEAVGSIQSQMSNVEIPVSNDVLSNKTPEITPMDNQIPIENGNSTKPSADVEGDTLDSNNDRYNNNNDIPMKSPSKTEKKLEEANELALNGDYGIKAKALYDYQAADNTEISFDPNDIIGFIEKVDSGWWQGSVITGPYKGQSGLFPSNYVEEFQ